MKTFDCILCGSCVADILVRPVPLDAPIGAGQLLRTQPIEFSTGGMVCNAGVAMAKLGMKPAALTYFGNDDWGTLIRRRLETSGVDCRHLVTHPTAGSSTSVVLIDAQGERTFAHCAGAPKLIDKSLLLKNLDLFAQSRMMLIGYYSLMPKLDADLPEVLAAIRASGCRTAMDTAGDGGTMQPLDRVLPHLDVYVPSLREAEHQTGESNPRKILDIYRRHGAPGVLGVKLGANGAMLSSRAGEYLEITAITPPGPVIDTTGAGDCFFAGLLTGLLKGFDVATAGRFAAAVGACCVTALGATAGVRDFGATAALAGC
jgi:sugar/nucleoside kinase (ribokinase family)